MMTIMIKGNTNWHQKHSFVAHIITFFCALSRVSFYALYTFTADNDNDNTDCRQQLMLLKPKNAGYVPQTLHDSGISRCSGFAVWVRYTYPYRESKEWRCLRLRELPVERRKQTRTAPIVTTNVLRHWQPPADSVRLTELGPVFPQQINLPLI